MRFDRPLMQRVCVLVLLALLASCDSGGADPIVRVKTFAPVHALTADQVSAVMEAAASASDAPDVAIAILDRVGNPLRLYLRGISARTGISNPELAADLTDAERDRLDFVTAIARAAAFLSHSQAPLSSRTGQFLSSFHFPVVFDETGYLTSPPFAFPGVTLPVQATIGVANTAQAPLWQIDASNRGTALAGTDLAPLPTNPPTAYNPGAEIPRATNPDGSVPSPGLGPLPGGVPLYDASETGFDVGRRLVGAIGVYVTDGAGQPMPRLAEFIAVAGAGARHAPTALHPAGEPFDLGVRPQGLVFLAGVLLPNVDPDPAGTAAGLQNFDPADEVSPFAAGDARAGAVDPGERFLIGPQSSLIASGLGLTAAEVTTLVEHCRAASRETHAAIRLPFDSACQMTIAICDRDGVLLGVYRELDGTLFSLEIAITKARNAVFFSDPESRWTSDMAVAGVLANRHPLTGFRARRDPVTGELLPLVDVDGNLLSDNGDIVDVFPPLVLTSTGVAVTARTLGFLTQPFYPPGIDGSGRAGPFHFLVQKNRVPSSFERQGFAPGFGSGAPYPDVQSGIIFFPGSAPLYRDGALVGGIGVSGDGVEQDDFVTFTGIRNAQEELGFELEPPPEMRADHFQFEGAGLPYFKFPQNPGG